MSDRRRQSAARRLPTRWVDYDTAMAAAFLDALLTWSVRHVSDARATVTIPTGVVTAREPLRVLVALDRARNEDRARRPRASQSK